MPPKRKQKKQQEPEDQFLLMNPVQLQQQLFLYKQRCNDIKTKRNYVQMDRDMVQQLYQNTEAEVKESKIDLFNLEADSEKMDKEHTVEVKMYIQRLKLLEFQQERSNIAIEKDGTEAKEKEIGFFGKRSEGLVKDKLELKKKHVESEKKHNDQSEFLGNDHEQKQALFDRDFEKQLHQREEQYNQHLINLKQELELKHKVEIHEVEERKNLHINQLMKNHQEGFRELQDFYNVITSENLKVIRNHKVTRKQMTEEAAALGKVIDDLKVKNNETRGPLKERQEIASRHRYYLREFEKHKEGLKNLKSKKLSMKEKYIVLQKEFGELDEKVKTADGKQDNLQKKFEIMTEQIKKDAEVRNVDLNARLQSLLGKLEEKEGILGKSLEQANIDPQTIESVSQRIKSSLQSKNALIRNLQYNIHHATKAYNDAVRVYQAKLVEFGIPAEELGFQPLLDTPTSTMPAGLVSS